MSSYFELRHCFSKRAMWVEKSMWLEALLMKMKEEEINLREDGVTVWDTRDEMASEWWKGKKIMEGEDILHRKY
jgi:hypothetical protein